MKFNRTHPFPFHPLLLVLAPLFFAWSQDPGAAFLSEIAVTGLIMVSGAVVLCLVFRVILRLGLERAALLASFVILMLFLYPKTHRVVSVLAGEGKNHGLGFYLVPFWSVLTIVGAIFIARLPQRLNTITRLLNSVAISVTFGLLLSVIYYSIQPPDPRISTFSLRLKSPDLHGKDIVMASRSPSHLPNIYYIILDAYARADTLEEIFEYDNEPFLRELIQKDFYVAVNSKANYAQTALSLASSLNMSFLDDLRENCKEARQCEKLLIDRIRYNAVFSLLKQIGYRTIVFSTEYQHTNLKNADVYRSPVGNVSILQNRLMSLTLLGSLIHYFVPGWENGLHRERILFALKNLASATKEIAAPAIVFCHIPIPHPPFIFTENGSPLNFDKPFSACDGAEYHNMNQSLQQAYRRDYIGQLQFLNKKIGTVIDRIILSSNTAPIIIIQADHGPSSATDISKGSKVLPKERMAILNAYYLPGKGREFLYPSITPVNTFRVIFRHYFGVEIDLLPDRSYFSTWEEPFRWTDVTERCNVGREISQ